MTRTTAWMGALAIIAVVFACGDSEESAGPPGTTPAAGGGVCCPKDPSPCGPGYRGGWAPTAGECVRAETYDGRFDELVDDHGCAYWKLAFPTGSFCCGCAIQPDATPDAPPDVVDAADSG